MTTADMSEQQYKLICQNGRQRKYYKSLDIRFTVTSAYAWDMCPVSNLESQYFTLLSSDLCQNDKISSVRMKDLQVLYEADQR